MINRNLCQRAVSAWGVKNQLDIVVEECSELIKAIMKLNRGQGSVKQIIEEAVDVSFMIEQIKVMFPVTVAEDWDFYESMKAERLERLLNADTK